MKNGLQHKESVRICPTMEGKY